MIKKTLFLSFVFISLFSLCSCSSDSKPTETKENTIRICSSDECLIIYGASASDYVVKSAKAFGNSIKNITGAEVTIASDWKNSNLEAIDSADRRIKIYYGMTNCESSKEAYLQLPEEGYRISLDNNNIIIAATTERLLTSAGKRFLDEFSQETDVVIEDKMQISESAVLFKVADNSQSNTKIVIDDDSNSHVKMLSRLIADMINKKCNTSIEVVSKSYAKSGNISENQIIITSSIPDIIGFEENAESGIIRYYNGNLYIYGNDTKATLDAMCKFINLSIINYDRREGGGYLVSYAVSEVTQCGWKYPFPCLITGDLLSYDESVPGCYKFEYKNATGFGISSYIDILTSVGYSIKYTDIGYDCINKYELSNGVRNIIITYTTKSSLVNIEVNDIPDKQEI